MSGVEEKSFNQVARGVLDNLLEGCQVIDFNWRYRYVNDALITQGRQSEEQLLGQTMMACYPGIEKTLVFEKIAQCMTQRKHDRMENEFTYPDGAKGWFELRFVPVPEGVCILSLDITHQKNTAASLARTEEQLRHAQKMEAVGRLAAGVAHDFNNILSVVLSYTSMLIDELHEDNPMHADLEEIKKAGERAAGLTRQLLTFSRQQLLKPQVLDLNVLITRTEKMLRRMAGEGVAVKVVLGDALGKVKADPGHLEQVLMNLVVNACDAMPGGGKLTIETQNINLDEAYSSEHFGSAPGACVMLAISDTGIGMDKEIQQRIFEPFFTTKEKGKGTGLGLSTVFGIVRQSGGNIWVYSEPGRGSTFKIYLPRTGETEIPESPPTPTRSFRGTETVLLVEDEEQLRVVVRGILRRNGYHLIEARDGEEALRMSENHQEKIHLLLTDVVMPHMNGPELAERLLPTRPDMRVLYVSGYTEDAIVHHRVVSPGVALLQKPITPEALLRRVRVALDAPLPEPEG